MPQALDINAFDFAQTEGAVTGNLGQFEVVPNTVGLVKAEIFCVRSTDLATKGWTLEVLFKRVGSGAVVIQETLPAPANLFASVADTTSLAGVSIAPFSDSMFLGVSCIGQVNDLLYWSVKVVGRVIPV